MNPPGCSILSNWTLWASDQLLTSRHRKGRKIPFQKKEGFKSHPKPIHAEIQQGKATVKRACQKEKIILLLNLISNKDGFKTLHLNNLELLWFKKSNPPFGILPDQAINVNSYINLYFSRIRMKPQGRKQFISMEEERGKN